MKNIEKIFVVRIYRQNEKTPSDVMGIVEDSSSGKRLAFRTFDELILQISGKCSDKKYSVD